MYSAGSGAKQTTQQGKARKMTRDSYLDMKQEAPGALDVSQTALMIGASAMHSALGDIFLSKFSPVIKHRTCPKEKHLPGCRERRL